MIKASEALHLSKSISNVLRVIEQRILDATYINRTFCCIDLPSDIAYQVRAALEQHGYIIETHETTNDKTCQIDIHWNKPTK